MRPRALPFLLLPLALAAAGVQAAVPSNLERGLRSHQRLADSKPSPGVFNDLGNLLLLDGQRAAAEEAYRQALTLEPEYAPARLNLALLLSENRRPKQAMSQLRKLLRQHPGHAWGHYYAGVLHAERDHTRRALEHYSRALTLDPSLAEPLVNPHIVRNSMRTHAMLAAYIETPEVKGAPRVYQNPRRVARQLVPAVRQRHKQRSAPDQPSPQQPEAAPDQPAPQEDGGRRQ